MVQELLTSIRVYLVSVVVCCLAYPALLLGFARLAAPEQSQGSLLYDENGQIIGSMLIAQKFTEAKYFWPRPSAVDYRADAAGGSNLSPASADLKNNAEKRIAQLSPGPNQYVPAELVTASGSGLDPHISLPAAYFQAPRVAKARGLSVEAVKELIDRHVVFLALATQGSDSLVNVLELNLALDALEQKKE